MRRIPAPTGRGNPVPDRTPPGKEVAPPEAVPPIVPSVDPPSRRLRHVYRVGGFRVPAAGTELVRGPRSRVARRVKDLLRRRAEAPVAHSPDPSVYEPPIREPSRPASGGPSRGRMPGTGREIPDDDDDDCDGD
jgi:hypothetical protein